MNEQELKARLAQSIKSAMEQGEYNIDASWPYQDGVLLSYKEAAYIYSMLYGAGENENMNDNKKLAELGQVWQSKSGRKFVIDRENVWDVNESVNKKLETYSFVTDHAHQDDDYSYECDRVYCRCSATFARDE